MTECLIKGEEVIITLKNKEDVPKVAGVLGMTGIALFEMKQVGTWCSLKLWVEIYEKQ